MERSRSGTGAKFALEDMTMAQQQPAAEATPVVKKKPVRFPYRDLAAAQADEFRKVGGPDGAFRYLVKGYKSVAWRKRSELNVKAEIEAENAARAAKQAKS
jgi:hypothetical protein